MAWLAIGYGDPFPEKEPDVIALQAPKPPADKGPELTADERDMLELFRSAPLMLKMQVVQALSIGKMPQTAPESAVNVTGDGNQTAGRDVNQS